MLVVVVVVGVVQARLWHLSHHVASVRQHQSSSVSASVQHPLQAASADRGGVGVWVGVYVNSMRDCLLLARQGHVRRQAAGPGRWGSES